MTASKLGAVVGVSESTVVRFATEIGYSGYPALQQAMQEMIRNRLTSVQRLEITSANTPLERLLDASLEQDIDIIRRTKETISHEAFYSAADALVNAKRVYIIGGRAARWRSRRSCRTTCLWYSTPCSSSMRRATRRFCSSSCTSARATR